jgi:hypothetical protein
MLSLRNAVIGEEVSCRVVDMSPGTNSVSEIGVQFAQSNPHLWRVSFPPADSSTHSPEAKRLASGPTAAQLAKNPAVKK